MTVSPRHGGSTASGFHIDSKLQFDLIDGLRIYNKTYSGLTVVEGFHHFSPAVLLQGDSRHLQLPSEMLQKISKHLSETNEFSFMATLKQEGKNTGTIISFSEGNNRFLELQSSGRKDEVRLHYTHKNSTYVETFPYHLSDKNWHQVAISVSGNTVNLYVDCNRIYKRIINNIDYDFTGRNISLWLGQRNAHHFMYKGYLQDVKIAAEAHGYIVQCPNVDTDCPTCGQFQQLQNSVQQLENHIKLLTERLAHAEHHISSLQQCECEKSCVVNGSTHPDGSTWKHGCDICSCVHGDLKCLPVSCSSGQCKNPVHVPGECCPVCLKKCLFENVLYDHGETISPVKCATCECINGSMHCRRIDPETSCPKLACPKEEQFSTPDECCNFCPGVDYCGKGHDCHLNASCMNLNTHYKCQCIRGFEGDGKNCEDINECEREGGHDGHHCRDNTKCVNIPGDYVCECLPGYQRADKFNCVEIDECSTGEHNCHPNSQCINTAGSYVCKCFDGYDGDGFNCEPVCSSTCLNGGECIAPNTCSCLHGYTGVNCETDVDECALGLHICHPNSQCINMPGWYYCQCRPGYESHPEDNLRASCQDIDECLTGSHTCDLSALCVNDEGGYHCECLENSSCSLNCLYFGEERLSGEIWASETCTKCRCTNGVVSCQPVECDCTKRNVNFDCCPHCDHSSVCQHQDASKSFHNGDQWIYQCQTCECLHGEIDCWDLECPPVNCENPVQKPNDCCLRCDDDPCSLPYNTTHNQLKGCAYNGIFYKPGEKIPLIQDPCSSCHCQDGFICCTYNSNCNSSDVFFDSELFIRNEETANNTIMSTDNISENFEMDQKNSYHSKDSIYISSKSNKMDSRLLSALFKDFTPSDNEQKRIKRSRHTLGCSKLIIRLKRNNQPFCSDFELWNDVPSAWLVLAYKSCGLRNHYSGCCD
ncbi:protein kinase C-binding protein NELL1 [Trichonephila inaurata madagascariensis]|uniref:Protein kinase C-binding protein NELL1 n=1 Tax=Trichonephila inaurata madagascariensis TaxID=2747483 RepID=A0A8X6Y4J7_9ARAC|nr:protein kinase C-binding protein NELL1 [Trichonephila inaurata madagascariensis]